MSHTENSPIINNGIPSRLPLCGCLQIPARPGLPRAKVLLEETALMMQIVRDSRMTRSSIVDSIYMKLIERIHRDLIYLAVEAEL